MVDKRYEPFCLTTTNKQRMQSFSHKECIIREYDWHTLPDWFTDKWNVEFFVITKDFLKSKYIWNKLQGNKDIASDYALYDYPERFISQLSHIPLWVSYYKHWFTRYNETGELVVRTALHNPDSVFGLSTFIKKS